MTRILIIDDDEAICTILKDVLEGEGYETMYCLAGEEGMRAYARYLPSVVLLDLLDVRTQEEHEGELGHLPNSLLIPVQELANRMKELEVFRGKTILAYCRTGNRSGKAAGFLAQHGFTAINMDGGMVQWNKQGLPVARDRE